MLQIVALVCLLAGVNSQLIAPLGGTVDILDSGTSDPTTVSSQGPDLDGCGKYAFLFGAAYCRFQDIQTWTCKYCKDAEFLGYKYGGIVGNTSTNTFCYAAVNDGRQEIVFMCRGSFNVQNFLLDAVLTLVPPTCGGTQQPVPQAKVHNGFLYATCSIFSQTVQLLTSLLQANPGYKVVFSGHSLGAAMGNVMGHLLISKNLLEGAGGFGYCGFGEPRVGNKAYADWWNAQTSVKVSRVTNSLDPVPHIPPTSLGYVHHGTELWFDGIQNITSCSKVKYEDPACSNSKGPVYVVTDHLSTWGVNAATCSALDPRTFVDQAVIQIGM